MRSVASRMGHRGHRPRSSPSPDYSKQHLDPPTHIAAAHRCNRGCYAAIAAAPAMSNIASNLETLGTQSASKLVKQGHWWCHEGPLVVSNVTM